MWVWWWGGRVVTLCSLPIFPTLPDDACKEPEPQFVFKTGNRVAARECRPNREKLPDAGAIKITRHARDVRHRGKIERLAFRRFHVEPVVLIQDRAADAVPVKPLAKIFFRQAILGNNVMHDEIG